MVLNMVLDGCICIRLMKNAAICVYMSKEHE